MLKKLLLSTFLIGAPSLAFADQGYFPQWPIANGASFCQSFVNGNCVQTIPAGPAPTGLETIPANTNLLQGQNPQNVMLPGASLNIGIQNITPLTGVTTTLAAGINKLMIKPAGTIAASTVVLPPATALFDGQQLEIYSTQTVTSLTVTAGTGTTVTPTITTVTAAAPVKLIYLAAATAWQLQ